MNTTPAPDISVVILTLGGRAEELQAAVDSALAQRGVAVEVVVVANGVAPSTIVLAIDTRVTITTTDENLGIPGGRNAGADAATAPLLAFLDDDASIVDDTTLARAKGAFDAMATLAAIALRLVDEDGRTAQRHVPRLGGRHPERSGPATAFLGGAVAMRRRAFDDAGRYPAAFTYAMEETDLSLRLIDRGWEIHYDGTPAVFHPRTVPGRHAGAAERTMRNRVWLAYRNLPAPVALWYVANWLAITAVRQPRMAARMAAVVATAWRQRPRGERSPVGWRTVLRLTRLGRPPIL